MQCVIVILMAGLLGVAFCAPNHSKVVVLESNEIPAVSVGAGGVSASWGGYSAKAGLGGNTGAGGGLFASADSPHGNAAAGLGGSVGGSSASGGLGASAYSPYGGSASAGLGGNSGTNVVKEVSIRGGSSSNSAASGGGSYGAGGSGSYASSGASTGTISTDGHTQVVYNSHKQTGGLFDNIFNIPISVLQAVNGLLNQQGNVTKTIRGGPPVRARGAGTRHKIKTGRRGHVRKTVYVEEGPTIGNRNTFSYSSSSASAGSNTNHEAAPAPEHQVPAAGSGGVGGTVTVQKRVNYDNIFNIPISALRAVNQLLNDGVASVSKNIQVQGSAHVSHGHSAGAHVAHDHAAPSNVAASASAHSHASVNVA